MAVGIAFDNGTGTDNGAGVPYVTASFTPTANARYAMLLVYAHTSSTPVVPSSVTHAGTGLTITYLEDQAYKTAGSNRTALALYLVTAGPSVSGGTFSITWAAAMVGAGWTLTDLDTYGIVGGNVVESGGSTASGANRTTTLGSPYDSASRAAYVHSANSAVNWSVEANWTELQEVGQTVPSMTRMVAWRSDAWDASIAVTNNNAGAIDNGVIAFELYANAVRTGSVSASADTDETVGGVKVGVGAASSSADTNGTVAGVKVAVGAVSASADTNGSVAGVKVVAGAASTSADTNGTTAGVKVGIGAASTTADTDETVTGVHVEDDDVRSGEVTTSADTNPIVAGVKVGIGAVSTSADTNETTTGVKVGTAAFTTLAATQLSVLGVKVALAAFTTLADTDQTVTGGNPENFRDITVTAGPGADRWTTGRPAATREATRAGDRWTATRGT